ncbi:fatty acid desaturase family protein [Enhygromyxa salina]|uniref:fatty acid desaturase family protein n=1 Tax=Enhygromyxa salina TaxID=215803 RepID=UPI0004E7BCD8|nr:fatty acid desaturase [Enhygromyxa salina]
MYERPTEQRPAKEPAWSSEEERLASLCKDLDAIHQRVRSELGDGDIAYIESIDQLSRRLTLAGRVLIFAGMDPVSYTAGILALAAAHQLQVCEIGHTALHGAYDKLEQLPGAAKYHSERFRWVGEIDEESWRRAHNLLHHGHTNIVGRDSDLLVGFARWSPEAKHHFYHRLQLLFSATYPLYWWTGMSLHSAGVLDLFARTEDEAVVAKHKSLRTFWSAHKRALRKIVPYKLTNYVVYPALAGPLFLKVLAGNWLADHVRDVYTAATMHCNHIGPDVHHYGAGRQAKSRGEWYEMQIEATNNFEVPHWMSVLCGGLDYHIEHHLFPKLPPNRLREIAPEIRAVCARHGVRYRTGSWPATLAKSLRTLARLSWPIPHEATP